MGVAWVLAYQFLSPPNNSKFLDNDADKAGDAGEDGEDGEAGEAGEEAEKEAEREAELRRMTAEEVAAAIRSGEMVYKYACMQ